MLRSHNLKVWAMIQSLWEVSTLAHCVPIERSVPRKPLRSSFTLEVAQSAAKPNRFLDELSSKNVRNETSKHRDD